MKVSFFWNVCILSFRLWMFEHLPIWFFPQIAMDWFFYIFPVQFSLQQYAAEQQFIQTSDNLVATRISLKLQLQSSHFHGSPPSTTGGLTLRCIAEIPNLYYLESSELELGVPQRDPVPARGKCACHLLNLNIHCISIQIGWLVDCRWLYVFYSVLCPFQYHAMPCAIPSHGPGCKIKKKQLVIT